MFDWCCIGMEVIFSPICVDAQGNVLFKLMQFVSHTVLFGLAFCCLAFSSFYSKNKETSIFSIVFMVCVQALMTRVCLKQSQKGVRIEKASCCEV